MSAKPTERKLSELLEHVSVLARGPEGGAGGNVLVGGVTNDSRRVEAGMIFVAVPGYTADGADFIPDAVARGAAAVVAEQEVGGLAVPVVRVTKARRALAELSAAAWGWPSRGLTVVGVTGTNGKTTTSILVARIAEAAGLRAAALGTLGYLLPDRTVERDRTTDEAPELQAAFAELATEGVEAVAMEVSSHALVLDRPWQTYFDAGVLTNITQDHLDFHADMAAYAAAKELLFTAYADLAREGGKAMGGAINLDDELARDIAGRARCEVVGFGLEAEGAAVTARDIRLEPKGTRMRLVTPEGEAELATRLVGRFNVQNALAAAAAATAVGWPLDAIVAGLEAAEPAPGRMERVEAGQDFVILVDYAHTPDALAKVLGEARRLAAGRVICVFGCGGDRDPGKRPKMGRAATELADRTVITSDNPRSEEPAAIIVEIVAGATAGRYEVEADRRAAIRRAVAMAGPGDVVVIAGKGHETYQILGSRRIHFDDREEAAAAVRELGAGSPA